MGEERGDAREEWGRRGVMHGRSAWEEWERREGGGTHSMIRSSFATIVSMPTLNRILTRWKSFRITSRTVACELRLGETPRLSNAVTYTEEREVEAPSDTH